jgi:hypothetical protein
MKMTQSKRKGGQSRIYSNILLYPYSPSTITMKLFTKRQSHTGLVPSTPSNGMRRGQGGLGAMTVPMWIIWVVAVVGWWVAFIGMCVGESKLSESAAWGVRGGADLLREDSATGGPAMGTLWFAIIFQAAVIVHLTYVCLLKPVREELTRLLVVSPSSVPHSRHIDCNYVSSSRSSSSLR